MSIINDALKKVQQGLSGKPKETPEPPEPPTETSPKKASYLFETPPPPEPKPEKAVPKKPAVSNNIKSFFAFICAAAIIAGSVWYMMQQFQINIPQLQRQAKQSINRWLHKEEIPAFKTKKPEDLIPLAKITIPPPANASASSVQTPPPATLNVHGIMSNATGNLALIDDQVYQEGDEVDGAKIIKINLHSIIVNINGKEKTIKVKY